MSSDKIPERILSVNLTKKKYKKTFEIMEGFCFAVPKTALIRPNTGRNDSCSVL
jgi:hypothetical protein